MKIKIIISLLVIIAFPLALSSKASSKNQKIAFLNNSYKYKDSKGNLIEFKKGNGGCKIFAIETTTENFNFSLSRSVPKGPQTKPVPRLTTLHYQCQLYGTRTSLNGLIYNYDDYANCDVDMNNQVCKAAKRFGYLNTYETELKDYKINYAKKQARIREYNSSIGGDKESLFRELKVRQKLCKNPAPGGSSVLNNNECIYYKQLREKMSKLGYPLPPY